MCLALNNIQVQQLRKLCVKAEMEGYLTPPILRIIYKGKWFKMFVPVQLGGLELSLSEALKLEESLSYIDGSLGWTVTLCAGANLFAGYIQKEKANKVFSKKKVCFGGSGAPSGVAEKTKNGYIVNGQWSYATGTPHLTHFTANCIIKEDGKTVLKENGAPLIRSFFFNKKDVKIHEDWRTMGLKATAGHSFSVRNLKVEEEQCFVIDNSKTTLDGDIYKYPFMPFAETTIAVNTLGMTLHFLDTALLILNQKYENKKMPETRFRFVKEAITAAQQEIAQLSDTFYAVVKTSWDQLLKHKNISVNKSKQIAKISRKLVKQCRLNVAELYPYCGLAATNEGTEINRIFRDIFTGSQHGLLTFDN